MSVIKNKANFMSKKKAEVKLLIGWAVVQESYVNKYIML